MNTPRVKKQIILKKNEDRRILSGHPWVFSNEVRETRGDPGVGDLVELRAVSGTFLGIGFFNPHSLITFRLLSKANEEIDFDFFRKRFSRAIGLRTSLYPESSSYRIVHGESDYLPGLIVDKYNEYLSVQTFSSGMDARLSLICDVLESLLHPHGIAERNESPLRTYEGLPPKKGVLRGSVDPTILTEHGLEYAIDVLEGQKTGFFLDQRENRAAIRRFCNSAAVLDCFCNDGGFTLNAARGGAASVTGIDSSAQAIARAVGNARRNNIDSVRFDHADVFERLVQPGSAAATYDVIILDPPSFTRSKKNIQTAKKGYRDLHLSALRLLKPGGILATSSCSYHIDPDLFLTIVDEAARRVGRSLQLLDWRGAAPDHPVLPCVPETRYLKFGIFRAD
jgi:23S rRNA (cytosine1962-C5)-methyltransferase